MTSSSAFAGYPAGLGLLDTIHGASKAEFQNLRPRWNKELLDPTRALVEWLGDQLKTRVSPHIQYAAKVNGSISPIHRDLRFAADKSTLYKDHLLLNFWEGTKKRGAPTLRLRISASDVGFAAGAAFSIPALTRWRRSLVDHYDDLAAALEAVGEHELRYSPPELKRPWPGAPDDHPARSLFQHKSFQARFLLPLPKSTGAGFGPWLAEHLVQLEPVHRWLVERTQ